MRKQSSETPQRIVDLEHGIHAAVGARCGCRRRGGSSALAVGGFLVVHRPDYEGSHLKSAAGAANRDLEPDPNAKVRGNRGP